MELAVVEVEPEPEEVEAELFDCIDRLKDRRRRKMEEDLVKRIEQARKEEGEDSPEHVETPGAEKRASTRAAASGLSALKRF